jgi:hypothetical protein
MVNSLVCDLSRNPKNPRINTPTKMSSNIPTLINIGILFPTAREKRKTEFSIIKNPIKWEIISLWVTISNKPVNKENRAMTIYIVLIKGFINEFANITLINNAKIEKMSK